MVPRFRGGRGDVCVCGGGGGRGALVGGGGGGGVKSRRILASISMGGPNLKS